MTNTFSKSMLKQTLAPVVLVVVLWVSMSSLTTYYVQWLEESHQKLFVENIVSIRAAEAMQILIWKLAAEWPDNPNSLSSFMSRWREADAQIDAQRQKLTQSAFTEEERRVLLKLDSSVSSLRECFHRTFFPVASDEKKLSAPKDLGALRLQVLEIGGRIEESTNELLKINQQLAEQGIMQRQRISRVVYVARLAMLVVGPFFGLLLGWRLSHLLHRSIARIAVTLRDASSSSENEVGTIALESTGNFHEVQQQAEIVAVRMQQVSRDLQLARREVLQSERLAVRRERKDSGQTSEQPLADSDISQSRHVATNSRMAVFSRNRQYQSSRGRE